MTAQLNLLADNSWVAAKRSLPKRVADEHDGVFAWRLVLLPEKGPAQGGLHAEHGEKVSRNELPPDHLRFAIGNGSHRVHFGRHILPGRQRLKRLATSGEIDPVQVRGRPEACHTRCCDIDGDEPAGIRYR